MAEAVLERVVPAQFPELGCLRRDTSEFLDDSTIDLRDTLLLVISELCTNAIEALNDPDAAFTLRIRDMSDCVQIEVEDAGPGFADAFGRPGSDDSNPRGRGLHVVRSLVDDFSVRRQRGKTIVRCVVYRP